MSLNFLWGHVSTSTIVVHVTDIIRLVEVDVVFVIDDDQIVGARCEHFRHHLAMSFFGFVLLFFHVERSGLFPVFVNTEGLHSHFL